MSFGVISISMIVNIADKFSPFLIIALRFIVECRIASLQERIRYVFKTTFNT